MAEIFVVYIEGKIKQVFLDLTTALKYALDCTYDSKQEITVYKHYLTTKVAAVKICSY